MPLTQNNLYHPFRQSFLGFGIKHTGALVDANGSIVYDINLYYQPVHDPLISSFFAFVMALILFIGEYLHIKILLGLKKDTSILRNITIVFVSAQMILWPVHTLLITLTNFIHPLNEVFGQWICTTTWFMSYYLGNVIFSYSFNAALIRYIFIVHTKKAQSWGKEKVKRLFLFLSMVIPLLVTLFKASDGAELDALSFFNKCYGKHHNVFLVETSMLNIFKKSFCEMQSYDKGDVYGYFIALLKTILCTAGMTTMIIMGSNLFEALIYYRLFSYINR